MTQKTKPAQGRPAKAQAAADTASQQMGLFFEMPAAVPAVAPAVAPAIAPAFVPPVLPAPTASTAPTAPVAAPVLGQEPEPAPVPEAAPVPPLPPVALEAPVAPAVLTAEGAAVRNVAPSLEALAQQLEASPDYRVARRLVPKLQWPSVDGEASADVARILVLDTETTGLEHSSCRIMELALLRVNVDRRTGQPVGPVQVYDGLEDPGQPIPPEVQKITGIDASMVAGQKLDEALIAELLAGVDLVVAHNAGFDRPFVEARLPAFAEKNWACSFADIDWKKLGHGSSKLESLALAHGWFYDAHRAETDCHALLAVLQADLPAEAQQADAAVPLNGLALLLAAADQLRYRLQATGAPFDAKDALRQRGYRWDAAAKVWHTRLSSQAELDAECEWLKTNVYNRRSAQVVVEALDARVRYANRPGVVTTRML